VQKRHFELTPNSWRSEDSRVFADLLVAADKGDRRAVCDSFGLGISVGDLGLQTDWDGTKIGIGSFRAFDINVTFEVFPKVDVFEIAALFRALEKLGISDSTIKFGPSGSVGTTRSISNNYEAPFIIQLLENIFAFQTSQFFIFNSRKKLEMRGAIKGRPAPKSLVINFLHGRLAIDCHVLDNAKQREVASLLFETARSAVQDLKMWGQLLKRDFSKFESRMKNVDAIYRSLPVSPLSNNLLHSVSIPPYPFGTKNIVEQCLTYWTLKGRYAPSENFKVSNFSAMTVDVARAFEQYAGVVLGLIFKDYTPRDWPLLSYSFEDPNSGTQCSRQIIPDHILICEEKYDLLIGEIKYSTDYGSRAHVSQLISYLDFNKFPDRIDSRTGVLVYPGDQYSVVDLSGFNAQIKIMTIPVSTEFLFQLGESRNFADQSSK
jgi:hypothetical protein